jgi:two-component system chemotaxis response regulator CheY
MAGRQILVVDDDDMIRDLIADALSDEGYAVIRAADGAEALRRVEEQAPALVLLDMRMPVMDGWRFAREYRALPGPHAPIVVMTAAENADAWCREIGGDGCLPKPFDLDVLFETVERLAGATA